MAMVVPLGRSGCDEGEWTSGGCAVMVVVLLMNWGGWRLGEGVVARESDECGVITAALIAEEGFLGRRRIGS